MCENSPGWSKEFVFSLSAPPHSLMEPCLLPAPHLWGALLLWADVSPLLPSPYPSRLSAPGERSSPFGVSTLMCGSLTWPWQRVPWEHRAGCPGRASDKGPRAAPVQAEIGHAALRARGLTVRTRLHRPLFRPPDTCALVPFWTVTPDSFSGIVGSCSEVCPPSLPSPLPSTVTLACLPTQHREAL